jgi:hypothetical protein
LARFPVFSSPFILSVLWTLRTTATGLSVLFSLSTLEMYVIGCLYLDLGLWLDGKTLGIYTAYSFVPMSETASLNIALFVLAISLEFGRGSLMKA